MFGATIRVTVKVCEPPRILDWEGGANGVHAYHAWLLQIGNSKGVFAPMASYQPTGLS